MSKVVINFVVKVFLPSQLAVVSYYGADSQSVCKLLGFAVNEIIEGTFPVVRAGIVVIVEFGKPLLSYSYLSVASVNSRLVFEILRVFLEESNSHSVDEGIVTIRNNIFYWLHNNVLLNSRVLDLSWCSLVGFLKRRGWC